MDGKYWQFRFFVEAKFLAETEIQTEFSSDNGFKIF